MSAISGNVTTVGDPDDWIACAFHAGTHAFAGVAAVSGGSYSITGLTAGEAYLVSVRPKSGAVWQANDGNYAVNDYAVPTDPESTPYYFQVTAATEGDLLWDSVALLLRMNGDDDGTTFTDDKGHTISRVGTPVTKTGVYKYGTASGYFDGTGGYLYSASTDYNHTGDFTDECWFYVTVDDNSAKMLMRRVYAPYAAEFKILNKVLTGYVGAATLTSGVTVTANAWHHAAMVRSGTSAYLYYDGNRVATGTVVATTLGGTIFIGAAANDGTSPYVGYLDDVRDTPAARYTGATYTIPTREAETSTATPTGATEPTWPTALDGTVVDGGVTWTNKGAMIRPLMQGPLIAA